MLYTDVTHRGIKVIPLFKWLLITKVSRKRALSDCICSHCAGTFELVGPENRICLQIILTCFEEGCELIASLTDSQCG